MLPIGAWSRSPSSHDAVLTTRRSDCAYRNVMMDVTAMYPNGYHPLHWRRLADAATAAPTLPRSSVPITHYLIDFGISTRFSQDEPSKLVLGIDGLENTVPELSKTVPYDPFKTDVYILGALFHQEFLAVRPSDSSFALCANS